MGRLDGKVAIITGGNSGVGAATAKLFAKEGAKVIITARREGPLEDVAKEIREAGGEVLPVATDISKKGDADKLVAKAVEVYGKLDILVNNAGVLEEGLKPIDRFTDEDLDRIVEINEKGTMYCMRAASAEMAKTGYGSIVNVASIAGVMGCGGAAYVASKAAIIGVTRHTALRFAGTNIRCNAVCPGTIVTPMVMGTNPASLDPDMMGQMAKHSDLKVQPCMPDDVANILLFLASDESRAITGQALQTDFGGTL
ncbi:SDR family NAD(P)-dependent oxidoreductase [Sporofaciens sp. SGI.106]|uniref:SDR family NAD(P)-dependent oxidoreductase n=1 Tax=Sporofaciens sp. SGI.106 TaxID=3420568 RepID=UPI002A9BFE25|nr:SDR family oxidoreductase [Lachnoclostridium sp.]